MLSFAHKPTLRGASVALRPIVAADAEAMFADLADAEAMRLTGTHDSFTFEQIERWCASRGDTDDRLDLAVVAADDHRWLGEAVLNDLDVNDRRCGFRIALSASARDRGVGSQATRLLVDHAFGDHVELHRIELEVFAFNERARAVYEKAGFVEEGRRRDALCWDGTYYDAIQMSLLRHEWEQLRSC